MKSYFPGLLGSPLFTGLSQDQAEKVLAISRVIEYGRGELIMEEGQAGESLFVMLEGSVEVSRRLVKSGIEAEEKSKTFARLDSSSHAVFGEIGLLEKSTRTATIRAMTDCRLGEIHGDDFFRLANADPEIGCVVLANIARLISSRLRRADDDLVKLTTVLTVLLKH